MSGRLVIIGGAPATGKTTLARALGDALGLPVITKDDIKESLAEPFTTGDREWSRQLGVAAYGVLFVVAERILAALAPTAVILCRTPKARHRYAERAAVGRHRVHIDDAVLATWNGDDAEFLIDIGTPRLIVGTTDGYTPDLERIAAFARGATVPPR
ncbi:MAG TPA: AAA family ATPase [Candidatus Limnocylindria bacterium]